MVGYRPNIDQLSVLEHLIYKGTLTRDEIKVKFPRNEIIEMEKRKWITEKDKLLFITEKGRELYEEIIPNERGNFDT
jgi:DNA-binding MarR family transcriptional regulator